jgi:hypothetical protein
VAVAEYDEPGSKVLYAEGVIGTRVLVVAVDELEVGDMTAVIVENTPLMAEVDEGAFPSEDTADDEPAVMVGLRIAALEERLNDTDDVGLTTEGTIEDALDDWLDALDDWLNALDD